MNKSQFPNLKKKNVYLGLIIIQI